MPRIVVRPRASADLAEIWAFIAEDSIKHADKFAASPPFALFRRVGFQNARSLGLFGRAACVSA